MSDDNGSCVRRLVSAPNLLAIHQNNPNRFPFFLESVVGPAKLARYDILFAASGQSLSLDAAGRLNFRGRHPADNDFLKSLDDWWQQERCSSSESDLPFTGGWFLFLGYELAGQIEPRLRLPQADPDYPVAFASRCPAALIYDHSEEAFFAVAENTDQLEALISELPAEPNDTTGSESLAAFSQIHEEAPGRYHDALAKIHDYILAGDVFQVNLSRLWELPLAVDPVHLYRSLRAKNPAPFAGIARWEDAAIVSSSPERLISMKDGLIQTRPIAGTRPRKDTLEDDQLKKEELIANPKERAEHIMLIDLERNDLGRICDPGSVKVDELMIVESYAHVHHIVSNVLGRTSDDVTPGQAIAAVFPGGTITGCPKVRCMEIIAELEDSPRGAYTGSMGYLNRDGSMDLNILIRTLVSTADRVVFRAGAGIVADSDSQRELEETRSKAKGLLLAVEAAAQ